MPLDELADLDHLVHEPARLAILTVLSACESADFLYLHGATGLTKGNLSSHLSRLENAQLIEVHKEFVKRKTHTQVKLTELGRTAINRHWDQLKRLKRHSERLARKLDHA